MKTCKYCHGTGVLDTYFGPVPCDTEHECGLNQDPMPTTPEEKITICESCNCMTHTMKNGCCGKCGAYKRENVPEWEAKARDLLSHRPKRTGAADIDNIISIFRSQITAAVTAERERVIKEATKEWYYDEDGSQVVRISDIEAIRQKEGV